MLHGDELDHVGDKHTQNVEHKRVRVALGGVRQHVAADVQVAHLSHSYQRAASAVRLIQLSLGQLSLGM